MKKRQALILGVGNTLLCDEGFGVHAVDYLCENYVWPGHVRLVDGGTRGLMLMAELMECDLVFVLDIVLGGESPGTVYMLEDHDIDRSLSFRQSMHQTGINDILASCELAGHRPEAVVFGFEPFDWQSLHAGLSPQAQALLPEYCMKVVRALQKWRINAVRRGPQAN